MIKPLSQENLSHPSQPSRPGVKSRCEGFGEGVEGGTEPSQLSPSDSGQLREGFPSEQEPSHDFKANREGCDSCEGFSEDRRRKKVLSYASYCGKKMPEVLRSHKFHRVAGSVLSVLSVPKAPGDNGHGTVGTLSTRYFTRDRNNDNRPWGSCSVCGSKIWWRRDGTWLCGRCHPEPQGKELFRLDKHGGG